MSVRADSARKSVAQRRKKKDRRIQKEGRREAIRQILAMPNTKTLMASTCRALFVVGLVGWRLSGEYIGMDMAPTLSFVIASSIVTLSVEGLNLGDIQNFSDPLHETHIPGLTNFSNKALIVAHYVSMVLGVVSYVPVIVAAIIQTDSFNAYGVYFWSTASMVGLKLLAQAFMLFWSAVSHKLLRRSFEESIHFLMEEEASAPDRFAALPYVLKRASLRELESVLRSQDLRGRRDIFVYTVLYIVCLGWPWFLWRCIPYLIPISVLSQQATLALLFKSLIDISDHNTTRKEKLKRNHMARHSSLMMLRKSTDETSPILVAQSLRNADHADTSILVHSALQNADHADNSILVHSALQNADHADNSILAWAVDALPPTPMVVPIVPGPTPAPDDYTLPTPALDDYTLTVTDASPKQTPSNPSDTNIIIASRSLPPQRPSPFPNSPDHSKRSPHHITGSPAAFGSKTLPNMPLEAPGIVARRAISLNRIPSFSPGAHHRSTSLTPSEQEKVRRSLALSVQALQNSDPDQSFSALRIRPRISMF
jgi:hypothetical protein